MERASHAGVRHARHASPRVLFLGDFITWGYAATDASHAYAVQVTTHLGGMRIGYDGEFGSTVERARQMLETYPLPTTANVIVIELGTRDTESSAAFRFAYFTIMAALLHADPGAHVICLSPWQDPTVGNQPGYWSAIQEACHAVGGVSVSLYSLFLTSRYRGPAGIATYRGLSDWYHPNDAGHAAIAQAVLAALS